MTRRITGDLDAWRGALGSRADDAGTEREAQLGADRDARRFLVVAAGEGGPRFSAMAAGSRHRLRTGLQRLLPDALAADQQWVLRWLLGRWPRGAVTVAHALHGADASLELGIIAPLTPTRVALSEGPLPFSIDAVRQVREVHDATGQPGMLGCRLATRDARVDRVTCRWPIDPDAVAPAAGALGVPADAAELVAPLLEGLGHTASAPLDIALEGTWDPAPRPGCVLEAGPAPMAQVLGLVAHVHGKVAAGEAGAAARDLKQRTAWRVRVTLDAQGMTDVAVVLAPRGQSELPRW